jgi:signal transduction histidine kinase
MRRISLQEKMILAFIILGFFSVFTISLYSFYSTKNSIINRTFEQLTALRAAKKRQIQTFFPNRIRDIELLASASFINQLLHQIPGSSNKDPLKKYICKQQMPSSPVLKYLFTYPFYKSFVVVHHQGAGIIIQQQSPDSCIIAYEHDLASFPTHSESIDSIPASGSIQRNGYAFYDTTSLFFASPVYTSDKNIIGYVYAEVPFSALSMVAPERPTEEGMGNTGEVYLINQDSMMITASRFIPDAIMNTRVTSKSARLALEDSTGTIITNDYRDVKVLSAFSNLNIAGINWGILAEIDYQEAMKPVYAARTNIVLYSSFILLFFFVFTFIIARTITNPLNQLKEAAIEVGKGNYKISLSKVNNDEIGALSDAFLLMTEKIKEKTAELMQERYAKLTSFLDGDEIARKRLSRELHDGIGQSLSALKMQIDSLQYIEREQLPVQIIKIHESFDIIVDDIRRMSDNLMPSVLESFGLILAVKDLCHATSEQTKIEIRFKEKGSFNALDTRISSYLYRIIQEAINNIVKHAEASLVHIYLQKEPQQIHLVVEDDGIGFDPDQLNPISSGHGISNMKDRINVLHGRIEINSSFDSGTKIELWIPAI